MYPLRFGEFCSLWAITQPAEEAYKKLKETNVLDKYKLFSKVDKDGSGFITSSELIAFLRKDLGISQTHMDFRDVKFAM